MNTHHESLINNLTTVMWAPGDMGAFFMRFIEDHNFIKAHNSTLDFRLENLEWKNWDRTYQYLNRELNSTVYQLYSFNSKLSLLKNNYSDDEYHKAVIYVMYQLTEPYIQKNVIFSKFGYNISEQLLLELSEAEPLFDISKFITNQKTLIVGDDFTWAQPGVARALTEVRRGDINGRSTKRKRHLCN